MLDDTLINLALAEVLVLAGLLLVQRWWYRRRR